MTQRAIEELLGCTPPRFLESIEVEVTQTGPVQIRARTVVANDSNRVFGFEPPVYRNHVLDPWRVHAMSQLQYWRDQVYS